MLKSKDEHSLAAETQEKPIDWDSTIPEPKPLVALKAPRKLSFCEGLQISIAVPKGDAGRPVKIVYKVVGQTLSQTEADNLKNFLNGISSYALSANVQSNLLPTDETYTFSASVTNWLGHSTVQKETVVKYSESVPTIVSSSASSQVLIYTDALSIQAKVIGDLCSLTRNPGVTIQWKQLRSSKMAKNLIL